MTKKKIEKVAEELGWTVTWDKNNDGTKCSIEKKGCWTLQKGSQILFAEH